MMMLSMQGGLNIQAKIYKMVQNTRRMTKSRGATESLDHNISLAHIQMGNHLCRGREIVGLREKVSIQIPNLRAVHTKRE